MNKVLLMLLYAFAAFAQKIPVAELQVKIAPGAVEEMMYGFAEGDRIIFTVEAQGSPMSEITVTEFPSALKYKGQNVKEEKKEFTVQGNSVYVFRFANTTRGKRNCNIIIQRVPKKHENKNFNTAVKWVQVQDTAWTSITKDVVAGYDTLHTQKTRRIIAFERKYEEMVFDKSQRVSAKSSFGETRSGLAFSLPVNSVTKDETKKIVAWAYWVGVGEESNEFWKQNRKLITGAVKGAVAYFTSPLGGIAAGVVTNLVLPVNGEDVEYALVNAQNYKFFLENKPYKSFDSGKGIAGYKRISDADKLQGKFTIALSNDNLVQPIDVNVKVAVIIEHIKYQDEKYMDITITPRYEKRIVREPKITVRDVPVPAGNKI
ncbi:hypothetical protein [uncultured Flavobacterium sp.]|uniref:hypothetical protein n=1 Tax=uncultured Flavobacterium sp. TaxID=165435 RepID=UPI0025D0EF7B|nr:hypothetical protein [uncultured Flavobacterium sp.]